MKGLVSPRAVAKGKVENQVKYSKAEVQEDDEAASFGVRTTKTSSHGNTYVYACAFFASLNSVLLGYGILSLVVDDCSHTYIGDIGKSPRIR